MSIEARGVCFYRVILWSATFAPGRAEGSRTLCRERSRKLGMDPEDHEIIRVKLVPDEPIRGVDTTVPVEEQTARERGER